ncbi:hypothetical protein G7054_g13227 [Neopestalotiopsis clavispora]|nr:hypothetical protein G7054_g13227 [Neopestalotiopsis clavispora]
MFNPVYGPGPGPGPSHRMSNHRYSTSSRHSSIQHLPVIEEDLTLAEKTALRPLVSALFWFPASPPQTHHHFGGGSSAVGCLYDSSGVEDNVVENAWVPPMMNGRTSRQRTRRRRTRLWYYRRRPVWLERRGGWRRLALFATFVLVCVVGLILGLTLGLRRNNSDSPDDITAANQFPAGSYAFTTALINTSTACTTNADTFRCYPYTASSNTSALGAEATFFWIISLASSTSPSPSSSSTQMLPEYVVSAASSGPFTTPSFTNVSAAVLGRGTDDERLSFRIPMDLGIMEGDDDGAGGTAATTCWFNGTATLGATIWTRRLSASSLRSRGKSDRDYSDETVPFGVVETRLTADTASSSTSSITPWPFAVQIERVAAAAPDVPTCLSAEGNILGQFGVAAGGGSCSCVYNNLGPQS